MGLQQTTSIFLVVPQHHCWTTPPHGNFQCFPKWTSEEFGHCFHHRSTLFENGNDTHIIQCSECIPQIWAPRTCHHNPPCFFAARVGASTLCHCPKTMAAIADAAWWYLTHLVPHATLTHALGETLGELRDGLDSSGPDGMLPRLCVLSNHTWPTSFCMTDSQSVEPVI